MSRRLWIVIAILIIPVCAGAQILMRSDCTAISSPVTGQSVCFDSTNSVLKVWNGASWQTISFSPSGATFTGNLALSGLGSGIVVNALGSSTTTPAIVGQSTGFYGGLFFNVTDLGADVANAAAVGVVGQSAYANAVYAQQGAISGTGSTLARDNIYPSLYATRVIGSLNGHNFTAPVFRIDDTTTSSGALMDIKRGGTTFFSFSNAGVLTLSAYGGGSGVVTVGAADSGGAGFRLLRVPN